ncbi:MAG TPA: hypothetical protein VFN87_21335 [Solirubrobacteraceae bacterium]|nr:hypothetical protein [Solirubrobacteraceae bacterium]
MSAAARRLWTVITVLVLFCVGFGLYVGIWGVNQPPTAAAQQTPAGAHLYIATVASAETNDPHPTWVSYYSVNASSQHWVHATTYTVPANSVVTVTIYQYDGNSGLRNPFIAQASGTVGGNFLLNGKPTQAINPDNASHIFAIPELGVTVPLQGISDNAKNPCGNAPCSLSQDHNTITFKIRTGKPGLFRWQCFVPCAAGYIYGFGGPMQTVGYMDGFIKVV